jgi:hypothetical protein
MKITFTHEESENYFYNSLCNGLGEMGGYGLSLDFDEQQYKSAKEKLKSPCFEDVLMQILRDGGSITLVDEEGEGAYTNSISMKDVHERVAKTPIKHLTDAITENDDAITADVIIQTVFFEDIIFG